MNSAQFSPDERYVVTASDDFTARVWDAQTGEPVGDPLQHENPVTSAQFSPDGKRIVTSGGLTTQLWDAQSGQPLTEAFRHEGTVNSVQFSPDGQWLVTASLTGRVWNIATAGATPVPDWFASWAEVVGGRRFTSRGLMESVPVDAFFKLKRETMERDGTDVHTRVAQWFFTDRAEQTISPFSSTTRSDYIRRRIEENTLESLREVLFLAPANGVALARLAIRVMEQDPTPNSGTLKEARFYADQAVRWAPGNEEAWDALDEIQLADEHLDSARHSADRALKLRPDSVRTWRLTARILERRQVFEEAVEAYDRTIDLARRSDQKQYREALKARANLFRELGREKEALEDTRRAYGIDPRSPGTDPRLIDLSRFYNGGLDYRVVDSDRRFGLWPGNDLSQLPTGIQTLAGVAFDVRGLIQLGNRLRLRSLPSKVEGIPVNRRCRRVYFLHSTQWGFQPLGTEVARFRLHYSDGAIQERPIILGADVDDWWVGIPYSQPITNPDSKVAWTGSNEFRRAASGGKIQLFITTSENPHPEKQITEVDFLSTDPGGNACPFLVAMTVE